MIKIKTIEEKHKNEYFKLVAEVEKKLENKNWWLPISEQDKINFFIKEKTQIFGAFDGDKLIGVSSLFYFDNIMQDVKTYLKNLNFLTTAKISRSLVLPEYRGMNIMYKINMEICKFAKEKGYTHLMAIAHPDNIASNKSLIKLGMQVVTKFTTKQGYVRNLFLMKI